MQGFPFMTRELSTHQRLTVCMFAKVDGSLVAGGTAVITGLDNGAAQHMTVTENGDGDYTFILNNPGQRFVGCIATGLTALSVCTADIATDGTSMRVKQTTASTGAALADADFWLGLWVSHAEDQT